MLLAMIDVHVSKAGRIQNGQLTADPGVIAKCTLCNANVDATAALGALGHACANCLRERLDALSVARFRLTEGSPRSSPWGKVTG